MSINYGDYDDEGNWIGGDIPSEQQPVGTDTDTTYTHQLPYQQNTDPDNQPPAWLHDPNAQPLGNPGDGNYWTFDYANMTWKVMQQGQMNPPQTAPGGWQTPGGYIPANSGNANGYMDLSYWMSRGFPPEAIFDTATGALKPGWTRTANGYEHTGADTSAHTPATIGTTIPGADKIKTTVGGPGGVGGGGRPGGGRPGSIGFDPGNFQWPTLDIPAYNNPYGDYVPTTWEAPKPEDVYKDPSYQFRVNEGEKPIVNQRALQGLTRGGATMKALQKYGQNFASDEFGRIYDRAADTYDRTEKNRKGAFDTNVSNFNQGYGYKVDEAKLEFAPKFDAAKLQFAQNFDIWKYLNDDVFRYYNADLQASTQGSQFGNDEP